MTSFEIPFRLFECHPQSYQLKHTFIHSIELIFKHMDIVDIDMNPYQLMIDPIVNRNFGNTFHHQNGPNQRQRTSRKSRQQYYQITPRQQYHHRNTGKKHQHRHPSQQNQPISFQRHRTSSIPYLKENCLGFGLNNKGVR